MIHVYRYEVRVLSDYFDRAGLRGVPANQLGMIEQVVISHGRTFTGTFYSSFSAHVFRHRLYLGKVGGFVGRVGVEVVASWLSCIGEGSTAPPLGVCALICKS